jgi:2-deoxy-D-gluconate 3-dehydrogenase
MLLIPEPTLFRLDGRCALVTGAARGIGRAIAVALAEAGANLALVDSTPLQDTLEAMLPYGARCLPVPRDLSQPTQESCAEIIHTALNAFQRVDILVNCAGIIRRSPAVDLSEADWHDVLAVDLTAVFYLSQALGRHWLAEKQRGKILNVASMLSFQGGLNVASYTAAKSGIAGITRALANEWARYGINVNAIAPGYIATEVTAGLRADPERNRQVLERIPAGRWGDPDDVKGAAVFLCAPASDYVHGVILPVDGGWLAR